MSRSGYSDDLSSWDLIKYRGQVASAIRGQRGQKLLADLLDALESMPNKRLFDNVFDDGGDCVCALGAVGRLRGVQTGDIDPEDYCAEDIATRLDIARQLAAEVMYVNDEGRARTPEERWAEVYGWTLRRLRGPRLPFAPRPEQAFNAEVGVPLLPFSRGITGRRGPTECEPPSPALLTQPLLFNDRCADTSSSESPSP